jgi:hypothetical protein
MWTTKRIFSLAIVGVVVAASVASAGFVSDPMFTIEASQVGGNLRGEFEVGVAMGVPDGDTLRWELPDPILLIDVNENGIYDEDTDTQLDSANLVYVADPVVTLNFVVSSGSATNFTVNSALLSFPSIPNAIGRATAAVTVTDFAGNGASLTGLEPGGKAYQAFYNNTDPPPTPGSGSSFATLVSSISTTTGFASVTGSESFPLTPGFSSTDQGGSTLGTVSNMSSRFMFRVSAGDAASGTSSFVIVPEPAGMLLVVVGIVALAVRRRRA